MRQLLRATAAALCALSLTACATTMSVGSHVGRGVDFARYRTYDWGPADALPMGDPRLDQNPFFQDRMQGAVEKQLAATGFERSTSGTPDLLIHYHASINRRIDADRVDRARGYCWDEDCQAGTFEYEAGTLILDIVDPRTKRVIWRGWAQDSMEGVIDNQEWMERKVDDAVARIMERLPRRL